MKLHHPLILAALLGVVPLAQAQSTAASSTQAPASATSPAKKALIAKLVQLQLGGGEAVAAGLLQAPVGQLMQRAGNALQQLPQDKREAAAKAIEADVRKFLDTNTAFLKERAVKVAPSALSPVLDERFSEDELRQAIAWLESPVNRKLSQTMPDLQRTLSEKLMADAGKTMDERFNALQNAVGKHLGVAPAAGKGDSPKK
ncbi:DUF2059 domain-containing protein [Roseateles sp. BYS180W]|uniref:DUF2059 domain-containing protein n=1 Tax=Roseateles rivi TaxID=3299028 RepID=A0ABW7FY06_9BURK